MENIITSVFASGLVYIVATWIRGNLIPSVHKT